MIRVTVAATFLIAMLALSVWWEVSLWGECRKTNSFWYCARVLGK